MTRVAKDFDGVRSVRARRRIHDSPLADEDATTPRGSVGTVEDVIELDGIVVVEFDSGVLPCSPDEIEPWS